MRQLFSEVGRAFIRAFVASLVTFLVGILAAPNLVDALALAVAALIASVDAGFKAVQVFIPKLTLAAHVPSAYVHIADAALRAFVATVLVLLPGVWVAPDFQTARSLFIGVIISALTAAVRAVQGLGTVGESPAPSRGIAPAGAA